MVNVQVASVKCGALVAFQRRLRYDVHMQRVHEQLTDEQLGALRKYANANGEGLAAQVRKAVDWWIRNEERTYQLDRALEAIGGFHSGLGDLADRHDSYLDEESK
jgi:hypothetical protein